MSIHTETTYITTILEEIQQIPEEHLPSFLKITQAYRESVRKPNALDSFKRAWRDVQEGRTYPIETLWDGIDAE